MRFGANYTPRKGWFFSWLDLDLAEVQRDFEALRRLGMDHVRIFPLWPLLQPNRTLVRAQALDDVVRVVRVAADCGLDVVVDVLQGHLSSFDFLPSWVSSWHRRNLFSDPDVLSGQSALVRAMGERLSAEPNALGLSIGNEFMQFAATRHPFPHAVDEAGAKAWLRTLLGEASAVWPSGLHTHSYDDDLFFDPSHAFTPALAGLGDVTTVHSWVFSHLGPHLGTDHPGLGTFARYLCELAHAWVDEPGRELWLQEVGAPSSSVTEAAVPDFIRSTLRHLQGFQPLWGVTWWCSHDVSRSLADYPELEYTLGLIDESGEVKPAGRALAETISDWDDAPNAPDDRPSIAFPDEDLSQARVATAPTGTIFAAWLEQTLDGRVPSLVRASKQVAQPLAGGDTSAQRPLVASLNN